MMGLLRALARIDTVFGSDVYVSYSHQYAWQANQFGHVLIGLGATLFLGWVFSDYLLAFAVVGVVYFVKETLDALIAIKLAENVFPVGKREILFDGAVDFLFVGFGSALAMTADPAARVSDLFLDPDAPPAMAAELADWLFAAVFLALLAFFLLVRRPYLLTKRAFDKSDMPQLVRLSTFPNNFAGADWRDLVQAIDLFARGGPAAAGHLVVTGPPKSGRSTLAKAIGGDATAERRMVRYVTASRLMEKRRAGFETPSAYAQPYQVGEADLVIIDDLPVDLLRHPAGAEAAISQLIDVAPGRSIFEEPIRASEDAPPGGKPRPMPQVVWTIDDPETAREVAAALPRRFPDRETKLIELKVALEAAT